MICSICKSVDTPLEVGIELDKCDDCFDIEEAAIDSLKVARQIGVPKYDATSWRHIDPSEHMLHALGHLQQIGLGDSSEAHLSHAICRLAMAKAILGEQ